MILTHSATIQLSGKCVRPLSQNLWLEKLRTKKRKIILDLFLLLKKNIYIILFLINICMNSHVVKLSYTKMLDIYFIF